MKLLLLHADSTTRHQIFQTVNELGHIVVAEPSHPRPLLLAIARHQPHVVIIGKLPPDFPKEVLDAIAEKCPGTPLLWLPENDISGFVRGSLGEEIDKITTPTTVRKIQPYGTDEQRLVLHDDRYQPFAQNEKLGKTAAAKSNLERESDLFFRQVCCGLKNVRLARQYVAQLLYTDTALRTEIAYRVTHASYKVYWLREHAMRFAAALAHFIEGVEVQYLPSPATPSPVLDFVHYEPPTESLYAVSALISHGFRPALMPGLKSILRMKFTGQSDEQLIEEAMMLSGWCAVLGEVAVAQIHVMNEVLNVNSDWHAGRKMSRAMHRAEGIYGDFWGFHALRENPDRMRELARLAVVENVVPSEPRLFVTSYRDFREAHLNGSDLHR
jgi:hypothetical protein